MIKDNYIRYGLRIIITMVIIYLAYILNSLFGFGSIFSITVLLTAPIIIAGFFYYILRPVVYFFDKRSVPRLQSVLLIYTVAGLGVTGFCLWIWPTLRDQTLLFAENAPAMVASVREALNGLREYEILRGLIPEQSEVMDALPVYLSNVLNAAAGYITGMVGTITDYALVLFTVPIVLYYMLKEGERFPKHALNAVPNKYQEDVKIVLGDIDKAMSGFILGRFIVLFLMGILVYLGFLLIGQPYALLMTIIVAVLDLIPYFGPIIATVPVVIVAFIESPSTALWALVLIIVIQQVESNLLSPVIYGKSMDVHPLTAVLVTIAGGKIGGIFGLLLAIPLFMVVKIIVKRVYSILMLRRLE